MSFRTPLTLIALLTAVACAPSEGPQDARGPDPATQPDPGTTTGGEQPAETIPALASASPADGATGVAEDTPIVLEFTEPMDRASVEVAFESNTLGEVWFSWTTDDRTLTITPVELMEYAEGFGNDPGTVDALAYDLRIGANASSREGVRLDQEIALQFTTLKRMSSALVVDPALTGFIWGDDWTVSAPGEALRVGDEPNNQPLRAMVTFDLSPLPVSVVEIESATWHARLLDTYGNASTIDEYTTAWHVSYEALDQDAFYAFPHSMVGPFSTWDEPNIAHDVTDKVQSDLDERAVRGDRSQYRIQFESESNLDDNLDYYAYDANSMEIGLNYLSH